MLFLNNVTNIYFTLIEKTGIVSIILQNNLTNKVKKVMPVGRAQKNVDQRETGAEC